MPSVFAPQDKRALYDDAMRTLEKLATPLQVLMTFGLFVELSLLVGLAATPGLYAALAARAWLEAHAVTPLFLTFATATLAMLVYFSYATLIILVVPIMRIVSRGTPEGRFPYYSWRAFQWASYNALILLVRYTCINFLRVTPLINLFHALMGMRIGKRVQINTAIIADSNLIEIGDDSVIGGDVTLIAHSAEQGELITKRVKIGSRVTIGLMAVILPGCEIGDGAVIAAGAVLPKETKVLPREIWGGVPAKKIGERASISSRRAP